MPFLKHNKGNIYYSEVGEGEPILFIHGFGLDSRMWSPQVRELSKNHKIITYDLRGFGKSSVPVNKYNHVDDIYTLLKHLEIPTTKLVGHSFGGEIAIQFSLKYPDMVGNLILISSSLSGYSFEDDTWSELRELGRKGNITEIRERLLNHEMVIGIQDNIEAKGLVKEMLEKYSCWHFLNKDLREEDGGESINKLRQIDIPVSIILGKKDSKTQMEIANILDREIPNSTLTVVENAGHMVNLEKPERVSRIIKSVV